jgi:heptosyltransferase II
VPTKANSQRKSESMSARLDADRMARACLTRFGWKRLALSRVLELLLRPVSHIGDRRRGKPKQNPGSILVVEYWYLGDLVMITPFLKNLRLHYPEAHIAMLASARVASLLEKQDLVDEVIPVNVPWTQHMSRWRKYASRLWIDFFRCLRKVRARRFDWGFAGRADIRENFLLWVLGVNRRIGFGFGYGASLLTDVAAPDLERPHYSDRWLQLLEHIGKPVVDRRAELKVTFEEKQEAQKLLMELKLAKDEVLVGVHPGARNEVRQWGEQNFLEVARRLLESFPVKVLWFNEPGIPALVSQPGVVSVSLPLRRFLAVASECRLLICNDSGPMHLTAALGVPVVAVFGPGMPAWWGPRSSDSKVVAHEGIWCRPCFDYCIFDQPYCLRIISVDAVFAAAAQVMSATAPVPSSRLLRVGIPPVSNEVVAPVELNSDSPGRR